MEGLVTYRRRGTFPSRVNFGMTSKPRQRDCDWAVRYADGRSFHSTIWSSRGAATASWARTRKHTEVVGSEVNGMARALSAPVNQVKKRVSHCTSIDSTLSLQRVL